MLDPTAIATSADVLGAGLVSTIEDSAKFTTMLLREGTLDGVQILRPKTVRYKDGLTFLYMIQKKDAGTMPLTRKLRNIVFSSM